MAGPQGRPFYAPFANRIRASRLKAPIDPKDVDVIVDYLARTKGTE
jgi:hypothetical protein